MSALLSLLLSATAVSPVPPAAMPGAVAPFDLTYMPRTGNSVLALRPNELLKHFGEQEKGATDLVRRLLAAGFAFVDGDIRAVAPPALADIDQLIVSAQVTLNIENEKDGRSNFGMLGMSSGLVRTSKRFDWSGAIQKWFPKAETVTHAGRQYVRVPIEFGKETLYLALFVADQRTLAFDLDEDEIRGLLARLEKNIKPAAPPGWSDVCRETVALCHDATADGWLTAPDAPKREFDQALARLARKATAVALGFSPGDRTGLRAVVVARDECDALDARAALKTLLAQMANDDETAALAAKLFAQTSVNRTGSVVRARGEVKGDLLRRLLDPGTER